MVSLTVDGVRVQVSAESARAEIAGCSGSAFCSAEGCDSKCAAGRLRGELRREGLAVIYMRDTKGRYLVAKPAAPHPLGQVFVLRCQACGAHFWARAWERSDLAACCAAYDLCWRLGPKDQLASLADRRLGEVPSDSMEESMQFEEELGERLKRLKAARPGRAQPPRVG